MRLPSPELADPFIDLIGRRVDVNVSGQRIKGRLVSCRSGFLTIDPDKGRRITINRFEVSTIAEESRPASRCKKISRTFWR